MHESEVAQSCPTLSDPRTAAHHVPLSMGFYKQEYWSGVPPPSLEPLSREVKNTFHFILTHSSLIDQLVKNTPAMQETPVRFLGEEDPLEKG